ncbi:MAG: hypothetical protein ABSA72_12400, partial [Nitrososphaerales archaeon]
LSFWASWRILAYPLLAADAGFRFAAGARLLAAAGVFFLAAAGADFRRDELLLLLPPLCFFLFTDFRFFGMLPLWLPDSSESDDDDDDADDVELELDEEDDDDREEDEVDLFFFLLPGAAARAPGADFFAAAAGVLPAAAVAAAGFFFFFFRAFLFFPAAAEDDPLLGGGLAVAPGEGDSGLVSSEVFFLAAEAVAAAAGPLLGARLDAMRSSWAFSSSSKSDPVLVPISSDSLLETVEETIESSSVVGK